MDTSEDNQTSSLPSPSSKAASSSSDFRDGEVDKDETSVDSSKVEEESVVPASPFKTRRATEQEELDLNEALALSLQQEEQAVLNESRRRSSRSRIQFKPVNIGKETKEAGKENKDASEQKPDAEDVEEIEDKAAKSEGKSTEEVEEEAEEEESQDKEEGGDKDAKATEEDAEMKKEAGFLTPAEEKERQKLLAAGFPNWTRKHFQAFIRSQEQYGRNDTEHFHTMVEGVEPAEVIRYHKMFWKKYKTLKGWERLENQIRKAEESRLRVEDINKQLKTLMKRCQEPRYDIKLDYPVAQKNYTVEEDRFLLVALAQVGYGDWWHVQRMIRLDKEFRFDWFLKSRTLQELQKRCDYLIKMVEKDNKEWEAAEKKRLQALARKKNKSKSSSSKKSTSSSSSKSKSSKAKSAPKARSKGGGSASSGKKRKAPTTKSGKGSKKQKKQKVEKAE